MKINYKKVFANILFFAIFLLPMVTFGASFHIVTCDGSEKNPCDFAAAIAMINRIVNWFVTIAASIGALSLAYAGGQILLHPGNTGKITEARAMMSKIIWGLVWLVGGWLIVYTVIRALTGDNLGSGALRFLK